MPAVAPIADKTVSGAGCLILILGASGAGKDTLLSIAAEELGQRADVHFLRRTITRPAHDQSESFVSVTDAEFDHGLSTGAFCFYWQANGLRYGLPRDLVDRLERGEVVVVNGSRAACNDLKATFGCVKVVEIHVAPDVLTERLRKRGREAAHEIEARVDRAERLSETNDADLTIDNSGAAEIAGSEFARFIASQADEIAKHAQ